MFSFRLGILRSPLELVKGYSDDGKEPELFGLLKAAIPDLYRRTVKGAKEILEAGAATGAALNSKFAETGTFTLAFAELPIFFAGLTSIVGPPKPNLMQAMEAEHLHAANSKDEWTTGNYGITTTPETEWLFVTNPSSRTSWPKETLNCDNPEHGRKVRSMEELQRIKDELNKRLQDIGEELMGETVNKSLLGRQTRKQFSKKQPKH